MKTNRNRFSRVNRVVTCQVCRKSTTSAMSGGGNLCRACYDAAGLENDHSDNGHETLVSGCPTCAASVTK